MKSAAIVALLICIFALSAYSTPPTFSHIIIVVQENRTPDNLFGGDPAFELGVDLQRATGTPQPQPWCLGACFSPDHEHPSWLKMWNGGGAGWNNGSHACEIIANNNCYIDHVTHQPHTTYCNGQPIVLPSNQCTSKTWVSKSYDNGMVEPYYDIATRYGFANYFFQTNQGPSYPAHQFLFSGTSSPSGVIGGPDYQFLVADNPANPKVVGCNGNSDELVQLANAAGDDDPQHEGVPQPVAPCFDHRSMASLLDGHVTWKYYTQTKGDWATSIWTAPNSLKDICGHDLNGRPCDSDDWNNKVDSRRAQILADIQTCQLPQVSWVIPNGDASDHPGFQKSETYSQENEKGPSWVAAIINAVGNSWAQSTVNGQNHQCDYWGTHTPVGTGHEPTVILVVWDDWGGWWDHVDPATAVPVQDGNDNCNVWGCGNTYGFRVPFLVVSAFMPTGTDRNPPFQGYVSGDTRTQGEQAPYIHDFGSILGFVENNFNLGIGNINPDYHFADFFSPEQRATPPTIPLADFFCAAPCTAQSFWSIPLPPGSMQPSDFFTDSDTSDPDDDAVDND